MTPLTEREQKAYNILVNRQETGIMPTVRELANAIGVTSTSVMHRILSSLEQKGYISRQSLSSRAIKIENFKNSVNIPVLGRVTAGIPILATEQIEEYFPVSAELGERESLFGLNVLGLSMKNAGILDGDMVIANRDIMPQDGDIVIALIDDEATVKRLKFENGHPLLMPENPDFSPIRPESLQILGKVVGCFRRY